MKLTESYKKRLKTLAGLQENYTDYIKTNYSADGLEDADYDRRTKEEAELLYDKGRQLFLAGKTEEAEQYRQQALKKGSWLSWGDNELPPYSL